MASERLVIRNGALLTPLTAYGRATLVIERQHIAALATNEDVPPTPGEEAIDATGLTMVPGFIDLHVHGGNGYDTMDGTPEAVLGVAAFHGKHGTTSLLPSTVAASPAANHQTLAAVTAAMQTANAGARILGAHIEGPFLSPARRGAHQAAQLRAPADGHDDWLEEHIAAIRRLTIAPELPGALPLISRMREHNVLVSLGHTNGDEDWVDRGVRAGATHITHLFNAMSTLEKVGALRRVGVAETALVRDDLTVEVIGDGWHVPWTLIKLVLRAKGVGGVALVTDAMRAAGLPDGRYLLGNEEGLEAIVSERRAVTVEGGLAGSIATMGELVRNMVQHVGLSLAEAVQMATLTPARILGVADRLGQLAVGKTADVVLLDRDLQVAATIVGGEVVYRR